MVSRATTAAARATVSRPRGDSPGAAGSWSTTWVMTARKPVTVRVGHHQRARVRAAWGVRGSGATSGAHPGSWGWPEPEGGWPQPMRGFTRLLLPRGRRDWGGRRVHPGRVRARATHGAGLDSGRPPAAAEGEDGFAGVVGGRALGAGLGPAGEGEAAGHAGP